MCIFGELVQSIGVPVLARNNTTECSFIFACSLKLILPFCFIKAVIFVFNCDCDCSKIAANKASKKQSEKTSKDKKSINKA